ncbi:MAG: arsenite methyltransferase [Candidatus Handelsmanbacteria bacterium]|nr:arsenite methyltransferase [Candidatus Handelsmanbacteria bacterium]
MSKEAIPSEARNEAPESAGQESPCCGPSCCTEDPSPADSNALRQTVRQGYASIATGQARSCCGSGEGADDLARAIGYGAHELADLPEAANLGLSCGNPTALAGLQPGEVVLDLGSGAGFDVFIAGQKVGPQGRAIGVDMTPEMLDRARRNLPVYRERTGLDNVEFRLGEIEHLPIADASVDVVISNCVINLSPEKAQVWREIARVLRPGGRVAVSDLALRQPLPPAVAEMVEALVGCVAGAVPVSQTKAMARDAGLVEIRLEEQGAYIDAMTDWNDPLYAKIAEQLTKDVRASDYVTSLGVNARKPG